MAFVGAKPPTVEARAPSPSCRVIRAVTIADLDAATHLRWDVYSDAIRFDLGLLPARREINGFDVVGSATIFLAMIDDEPVGTIRLLLPDPELADCHGCGLGLPLAIGARFENMPANAVVAELGRAAVRAGYRGSSIIGSLYRAAYRLSRAAGVTHWTGVSLTGTDDSTDASIIAAVVASKGFVTPQRHIDGPDRRSDGYRAKRRIFDIEARSKAAEGAFAEIALPHAVAFHLRSGALAAGPPIFDAMFAEYTVPLFFSLDAYAASPFGSRYSDE